MNMDVFLSSDILHEGCCCQSWSFQLSGNLVNMELACPQHHQGGWHKFSCYPMDSLLLASLDGPGAYSGKYHQGISFSGQDIWVVYLPAAGHLSLKNRGTDYRIEPGSVGIFSASDVEGFQMSSDFSGVVLAVPASVLLPGHVIQNRFYGCLASTSSGPMCLAAQMAKSLPDVMSTETNMFRRRELALHLAGLLKMSMQTEHEVCLEVTARQQLHLKRLYDVLDARLGDPDLDLESLAADVHLSSSYVSRLFSVHGSSFRDELRGKRLRRVAQALADPAQKQTSVTMLAMENGFCNSSAFSRAFCKQFGVCPREYRKRNLPGSSVSSGRESDKRSNKEDVRPSITH